MKQLNIAEITNKITIKFPCKNYVIKVIGNNNDAFIPCVIKVIKQYVPDLQETSLKTRTSKNGKFITAQFAITATSVEQLKIINKELLATKMVHMVL